jgi:hypothetical protein
MEQQQEESFYDKKYKGRATLDVIRVMDQFRAEKERLESVLTEINKEYDYLRINLIPQKMEEDGIDNISVDGVGRVSLTGDMYVRVNSDNRDRLHDYLKDIGKSSLITETVNASTLKAVVKSMIRAGEEIPEEIIKVTPFTRASITKR